MRPVVVTCCFTRVGVWFITATHRPGMSTAAYCWSVSTEIVFHMWPAENVVVETGPLGVFHSLHLYQSKLVKGLADESTFRFLYAQQWWVIIRAPVTTTKEDACYFFCCFLFHSTPLPGSFQNSPLCRVLYPRGCAYLVAYQPKTALMYISPPLLKADESSAIRRAGKVKRRRAVVHVCLHLHSCFFIDPSGSWAVFMQMRQHLNICPKQLTWNKCLAAQKHGGARTRGARLHASRLLTSWFFSFVPRLPGSWACFRRPSSWL